MIAFTLSSADAEYAYCILNNELEFNKAQLRNPKAVHEWPDAAYRIKRLKSIVCMLQRAILNAATNTV